MRKEMHSVKCSEHILIGDPWYWKTMSGEKLENLVVDFKPAETFDAAVSIEERGTGKIIICVVVCFAPKEHMSVYLDGRQYTAQKLNVKPIGVDTEKYMISVDGRENTLHTGGNGCWGNFTEVYRENRRKKRLDAVIITLAMPHDMSFEEIKRTISYFFEDMKLIPEKEKAEEIQKGSGEPKR